MPVSCSVVLSFPSKSLWEQDRAEDDDADHDKQSYETEIVMQKRSDHELSPCMSVLPLQHRSSTLI